MDIRQETGSESQADKPNLVDYVKTGLLVVLLAVAVLTILLIRNNYQQAFIAGI